MDYLKTASLIFLFLFTFFTSAFSQVGFTPVQQKEYNKQKVSLDLTKIGMGSYGSGSISYSSWTKWKAYQGFKPISESQLYAIAGYELMSNKAKKRAKTGKTVLWTSMGLMAGGLVIMVSGDSSTGLLVGASTAMAGVVLGYVSIGINSSNMKPYGIASGIADEYNLQLSIKIKKKF